jgi:sugar lactone lactonase YvrE
MMVVKRVGQFINALGEGPLWHPQEKVLYWIDLALNTLHRLQPETEAYQTWQLPDQVGAIVPRASGGLIATLGNKVVALTLPALQITTLAEITPWHADTVMNDGKCDRRGRFWFGIAHWDTENPQGGLYRLDPNGQLTQMERGITISNGLGFSPDNKKFYYTDGLRYCVYQYDFKLATGVIKNRKVFLQFEESQCQPDGLTVDSEGYIWQAVWNSGKIFRYAPNSELDQIINMPVTRPTSCIFGGEHLNILYITSASRDRQETQSLPAPAGGLFAIETNVIGLPEPAFAG